MRSVRVRFAFGFILLLAAVGCSDGPGPQDQLTALPSSPLGNYQIIEDGSYGGYSRDVRFISYDGYAEMDGLDVTLEQQYTESHQWHGPERDGTLVFPNANHIFGPANPDPFDVARVHTAPDGSTSAYDRPGAPLDIVTAKFRVYHAPGGQSHHV